LRRRLLVHQLQWLTVVVGVLLQDPALGESAAVSEGDAVKIVFDDRGAFACRLGCSHVARKARRSGGGRRSGTRNRCRHWRSWRILRRLLLLLLRWRRLFNKVFLGRHQQQHRNGKNNHHALVYAAGLVLRILKLTQGSMPICAAMAASYTSSLTLRVRPRPVRAPWF